jgi:hypothetical protein
MVVAIGIWLLVTFVIIQPIVCDQLHGVMAIDSNWAESTSLKTPSNWTLVGSADGCTTYQESLNISDWFTDAWIEVSFQTSDGLKLRGFYFPGRNGSVTGLGEPAQAPTIISVHGFGVYATAQTQMMPARAMQDRGFNVLTFSQRGLAGSEPNEFKTRTFGADEVLDVEAAIKLVTDNPDGVLPFATPLSKIGIFTESGGPGMVPFFRQAIPGIIMESSIYDWSVRFRQDAGSLGIIPFLDTMLETCAAEKSGPSGGILSGSNNFKDRLTEEDVASPIGRRAFVVHNVADSYNLFNDNAKPWVVALKAEGFTVSTWFPDWDAPEAECNNHITLVINPERRVYFKKMCEFWEQVFGITASCAHFDNLTI